MLQEAGLRPGVMPVVPQIAAGCGLALRVKPGELELCRQVLACSDVDISAVYERIPAAHGFDYIEIGC